MQSSSSPSEEVSPPASREDLRSQSPPPSREDLPSQASVRRRRTSLVIAHTDPQGDSQVIESEAEVSEEEEEEEKEAEKV